MASSCFRWSSLRMALLSVALFTGRAHGVSNAISCIGDCNGDGVVTVDEIIYGVDIALQGFGDCPALDCNTNNLGVIENCLISAVHNAEAGCPSPAPTNQGACCLGECPGRACTPTTQRMCCVYADTSEITLPYSWCPPAQFDATTGHCTACSAPCVGLSPAP